MIPTAGTSKPVPPEKSPGSVTSPVQDGNTDFKIGERVWVNGNKPGYVHFVGGTQFAPGQWAGIVLDESIGKNDGSVAGVRYFQCEDGRGIFTRPSKLSRTALPEKETNGGRASPTQGVSTTSEAAPAGTTSSSKFICENITGWITVLYGPNIFRDALISFVKLRERLVS